MLLLPRFGAPTRRMETVHDIKEALSARSRTATLDELRSEGRQRVRVIRAEHIAAMVHDAVNSAIERSGLLPPDEVDRLVESSRQEFRTILKEREAQARQAEAVAEALEQRESELVASQRRADELAAALAAVQSELDSVRDELVNAQQQAQQQAQQPQSTAPAAAGPSPDLLMAMMHEMANMKASLMTQSQQPQAAAPGLDLGAAIDKLAGSLNDRLEKFGKKMGISAAVEVEAPKDFSGLFRDADLKVESNIEQVQVKQTSGGGIAANLAKLKKLKGGS